MKSLKIIFMIFVICVFSACDKSLIDPNLKITYDRLMDGMDLSCPESTSEYYLKANVDDTQVCYYEGVDKREFIYGYYNNFTTAGPGTSVGNIEPVDPNVSWNIRFSFKEDEPFVEGEDYIDLLLPKVRENIGEVEYLKEFFSKQEYAIRDLDVEDEGVTIQFRMGDKITDTGGLLYIISSEYGDQTGSFLKIQNVQIKEDDELISFDFDLEFECNLYHLAQNGREGLWSKLENGILKAKISLLK